MKKYEAWKTARDTKIAEREKRKADWEMRQKLKKQKALFKKTGIKVSLSQIKLDSKKKSERLQNISIIDDEDNSLEKLHEEVNKSIEELSVGKMEKNRLSPDPSSRTQTKKKWSTRLVNETTDPVLGTSVQ